MLSPKQEGDSMAKNNRVFVAFAKEDENYRDLLRGQAKNKLSPFDFVDMSVKEPFDEKWKTNVRTKMKGCDGFIVLLSKNTWYADGARWEISCAKEEGLPRLGLHIHRDDKGAIPPELPTYLAKEWTWENIKAFLDGL
jgi:hypothetical protein